VSPTSSSPVAAETERTEHRVAPAAATEEVVVLDYGGQYSQLIARRVRECGVFSELLPHHVGAEEVARRRPKGVILSGGPASVYADGAPPLNRALQALNVGEPFQRDVDRALQLVRAAVNDVGVQATICGLLHPHSVMGGEDCDHRAICFAHDLRDHLECVL